METRPCYLAILLMVILSSYSFQPIHSLIYKSSNNRSDEASSCACTKFNDDDYTCLFNFDIAIDGPISSLNLFENFITTEEMCQEGGGGGDGSKEVFMWVEDTIARCNSSSNRPVHIGTGMANGMGFSITFCDVSSSQESSEIYYTLSRNGMCHEDMDQRIFCPKIADTSTHENRDIMTVGSTVTSQPKAVYNTRVNRLDVLTAVGIGVASIIVFIVAITLVIVCCRRMSYRLDQDQIKHVENGVIEDNPVYGGQTKVTNIPVYAKPNKGPVYAKPNKGIQNNTAANGIPSKGVDESGYEEADIRPPNSGYEEATLSPVSNNINAGYEEAPATPARPNADTTSTPSGYEEAMDISGASTIDNFRTPHAGDASGYEDNFVTPGNDGYEDNLITPPTSTKESVRYDHIQRKLDLDEAAPGYGQVQLPSDLVDQEDYQHLDHNKKASDVQPGYGQLNINPRS